MKKCLVCQHYQEIVDALYENYCKFVKVMNRGHVVKLPMPPKPPNLIENQKKLEERIKAQTLESDDE